MAEAALGEVLLALAAMLPALLLAAKAHGRQVRLERELEGHLEVDFMADNHPWVEALWKRDRWRFWPAFAAGAALALLAVLAGAQMQLPLGGAAGAGAAALVLAGWAFIAAFWVAGFSSWARFARAVRPRIPRLREERAAWLAAARRGSPRWWGFAAAASLAWWALALR